MITKRVILRTPGGERITKEFDLRGHKNKSGLHIDKNDEARSAGRIKALIMEGHEYLGRSYFEKK